MIRRPWRSQPPRPVGIDFSQPIARDCVFFAAPMGAGAVPIETARSRRAAALGAGVSQAPTRHGHAWDFNGAQASGTLSWGAGWTELAGATAFTLETMVEVPNFAAGQMLVCKWGVLPDSYLFSFEATTGQVILGVSDGTNTSMYRTVGGMPAGRFLHVLVTWTAGQAGGAGHRFYLDGVEQAGQLHFENAPANSVSTGGAQHQLGQKDDGGPLTGRIAWAAAWRRVLSAAEIAERYRNPWGMLARPRAYQPRAVALAALARPALTTATGAWMPVGAGSTHEAVDEAVASDADYAQAAQRSVLRLALSGLAVQPNAAVVVRYRLSSGFGEGASVRLLQGATLIASWAHNPLPAAATTYAQTLTAAQRDAITEPAALYIEIEAP